MKRAKPATPATAWRSRIVREGAEAPDQLLANPANWRIHPSEQQQALVDILGRVGWVQRVIVNLRTSERWPAGDRGVQTVVDGHARVLLASRRDEPTVPVVYVDLDPDEEMLVLATLDPISALAPADPAKLGPLLDGITLGSEEGLARLLQDLAVREGLDQHARPDHGALIDSFTTGRPMSPKNEQWFYVEFYQDQTTFARLQERLRAVGALRGEHELSPTLFQRAIEEACVTPTED